MDPSFLRPLPRFGVLDLPRIFCRISHHTGVNDADRLDPGRSPKILQTCLVLQNASTMHHFHSCSILWFLFRMTLHHIASYCQFKQQTSLDNNYRSNNRQNSPTHELDVIDVLDLSSKVFSEIYPVSWALGKPPINYVWVAEPPSTRVLFLLLILSINFYRVLNQSPGCLLVQNGSNMFKTLWLVL